MTPAVIRSSGEEFIAPSSWECQDVFDKATTGENWDRRRKHWGALRVLPGERRRESVAE